MAKINASSIISQCDVRLGGFIKLLTWTIVLSITVFNGSSRCEAIHWDHSVDLNDDYRVLWNILGQEITFEVQVRTLGYVGFGFSHDGRLPGSDVAIGWVSQGQVHFQVSFTTKLSTINLALYCRFFFFCCCLCFPFREFSRKTQFLFIVN